MKERPILFSAPMVRALLAGTKTQTRRVVKCRDRLDALAMHQYNRCPYGQPGERLWVRENGWERPERTPKMMREGADTWEPYYYDADGLSEQDAADFKAWGFKRRPSIHMPRRACRLVLEIVGVRVQRLQDISEEDAAAEGCASGDEIENELLDPITGRSTCKWSEKAPSAKESFCNLWQRIHKRPHDEPTAWEENPWVWAVTFKRVEPSGDQRS